MSGSKPHGQPFWQTGFVFHIIPQLWRCTWEMILKCCWRKKCTVMPGIIPVLFFLLSFESLSTPVQVLQIWNHCVVYSITSVTVLLPFVCLSSFQLSRQDRHCETEWLHSNRSGGWTSSTTKLIISYISLYNYFPWIVFHEEGTLICDRDQNVKVKLLLLWCQTQMGYILLFFTLKFSILSKYSICWIYILWVFLQVCHSNLAHKSFVVVTFVTPVHQDLLRCRVLTSGIFETRFQVDKVNFQ